MTDGDLHIRNEGGGEVVVRNYSAGLLELTEGSPKPAGTIPAPPVAGAAMMIRNIQ